MIVAIILCDRADIVIDGKPVYFLPLGEETVLERVVRTVLRGPFGATIVATAPAVAEQARALLSGFAVQQLALDRLSDDPNAGLAQALKFAAQARARWQRAMAGAAARFGGAGKGQDDFSRHRRSPDVKIRGLAHSFQRDGVILFRGERPLSGPELQAHIVAAFGTETGPSAHALTRPVCAGQRGYPVLLDAALVNEVAALPPGVNLEAWLQQHAERVREVRVDELAAVESIDNAKDYVRIRQRFEPKSAS